MLTNKHFWWGFLIAYGLAFFLPPRNLFGRKKMG